ncbi:1-aminocyclopropane-1-carboxylate synthase-like protein 2 [Heterocephalus glaber]|uniref:1-aminocyclopropane-1-carboxylate synthase-like protein 2 n=1 Tax=Heterocephalus glaber TaxID=10181 RepID=G5BFQ4_HETGA|nr:1-aminocyclopropane-1-carboxylate synthase-like protein 2 [Heterocephalus glaber]
MAEAGAGLRSEACTSTGVLRVRPDFLPAATGALSSPVPTLGSSLAPPHNTVQDKAAMTVWLTRSDFLIPTGEMDYEAYQGDKYHTILNSLGFLNLGNNENRLCVDLMTERLYPNDMNYMEDPLLQYPNWRGHRFLLAEVAKFLTYHCGSPSCLNLRNTVVLNSCCAVFSALVMVLCDPGDVILVPTPFHSGFLFSAQMYAQVELIPVYVDKSLPDPNRTHVIWGSKDFGITAFCFGVLYTHNDDVISAMSPFGYLHSVSGITQYKLRHLLGDRDWINRVYLPTHHSWLREAYVYVSKRLRELEEQYEFKITFRSHGCGLYIWINLKKLLEPCTFKEEPVLHCCFLDHKLILSRGKSYMFKESQWFHLVFAENSQ